MKAVRSLAAIRHLGPWRIAAIEERRAAVWAGHGRVGGSGGKVPLAILIDGPGGLHGTDPAGDTLDWEHIEMLLPGALSRFAAGNGSELEEKEDQR